MFEFLAAEGGCEESPWGKWQCLGASDLCCQGLLMALFINYGKMEAHAATVVSGLRIDVPSVQIYRRDVYGGQGEAVALGRALACARRVFLMDESTAALGVEQSVRLTI